MKYNQFIVVTNVFLTSSWRIYALCLRILHCTVIKLVKLGITWEIRRLCYRYYYLRINTLVPDLEIRQTISIELQRNQCLQFPHKCLLCYLITRLVRCEYKNIICHTIYMSKRRHFESKDAEHSLNHAQLRSQNFCKTFLKFSWNLKYYIIWLGLVVCISSPLDYSLRYILSLWSK